MQLDETRVKTEETFSWSKTISCNSAESYVKIEEKLNESESTLQEVIALRVKATSTDELRQLEKIANKLSAIINNCRSACNHFFPTTDELKAKIAEIEKARNEYREGKTTEAEPVHEKPGIGRKKKI